MLDVFQYSSVSVIKSSMWSYGEVKRDPSVAFPYCAIIGVTMSYLPQQTRREEWAQTFRWRYAGRVWAAVSPHSFLPVCMGRSRVQNKNIIIHRMRESPKKRFHSAFFLWIMVYTNGFYFGVDLNVLRMVQGFRETQQWCFWLLMSWNDAQVPSISLKIKAESLSILSLSVTFVLPLAPFAPGLVGRVANCLCCVIYSGAEASRQESFLGGQLCPTHLCSGAASWYCP